MPVISTARQLRTSPVHARPFGPLLRIETKPATPAERWIASPIKPPRMGKRSDPLPFWYWTDAISEMKANPGTVSSARAPNTMESVAVLLIQEAWRGAGWCGNLISFMGSGVGGDS